MNAQYRTVNVAAVAGNVTMPSFGSLLSAELFKIPRNRGAMVTVILTTTYLIAVLLINFIFLNSTIAGLISLPEFIAQQSLSHVRESTGVFAMVLTVIVVGLEYQQGTIRVLLARGTGRIRLLSAKLMAVFLAALTSLAVSLLIVGIFVPLQFVLANQSGQFSNLPDYFWSDMGTYVVTLVVNLVASILLAATLTVLGRSLAVGLGVTLPWFFAENIISGILLIVTLSTQNKVWYQIPNFFFGNSLTRLPTALLGSHALDPQAAIQQGGAALGLVVTPDATFDAIVVAGYCAAFLFIAYFLTLKRDVTQ
ncbi:MAG TPA: hypothetical protein VKB76_17295 [Ktedonobacterales bacterium]|nr:hypothetical protein [Ktedonobacterales bacterium]